MANCCRLFTTPPGLIFEHPPTLPAVADQVPAAPIAGWECYATGFYGEAGTVFGPFDPVVVTKYGRPHIEVHRDPRGPDCYWFLGRGDERGYLTPARPCWFQSGATLRFVAKRGEDEAP